MNGAQTRPAEATWVSLRVHPHGEGVVQSPQAKNLEVCQRSHASPRSFTAFWTTPLLSHSPGPTYELAESRQPRSGPFGEASLGQKPTSEPGRCPCARVGNFFANVAIF